MGGRYVKLRDTDHHCVKPGWWARRQASVKWGAEWECECGALYRWEGHWAILRGSGTPPSPNPKLMSK